LEAREAALRYGLSLDGHQSRLLDSSLVAKADAVLVMEPKHLWLVRRWYPDHRARLYLLPLFEEAGGLRGYARYAIADPYGQPSSVFEACFARIISAVDHLVAATSGGIACRA
jgi:protein-tyrosine phosphatase